MMRTALGQGQGRSGLHVVAVLAVLLGIGLTLSGCDTSLVRTARMSKSWSKGLPLGLASIKNQVALAVDEPGRVYVVWVDEERDLHFVRLDERAGVMVDRSLALDVYRPQQPEMALDSEGQLHLTWLDKWDQDQQVVYARVSTDGEVLQGATVVSEPNLVVGRLTMGLDPADRTVEVFWSDNAPSRPGIYHAALDRAGTVVVPEEVLIPDGLGPMVQVDSQGYLHLAWRTEREGERLKFHYAVYDAQRRALGPTLEVGEPMVEASLLGGPTASGTFVGPRVGLDRDQVYLAWTLEVRPRGQLSAFTFYQAFRQPELGRRDGSGTFDYDLPELATKPVHVQGVNPTLTGDPQFLADQHADQVLACYTEATGPRNLVMVQSAVNALQAGGVTALDVVSATPAASVKPNVAIDGQDHLHLVWLDTAGFDRYQVLYASTAPQVQEVLNPVTVGEVVSQALELSFGALTVIGFLPLFLMWAIPAFLLLLVFFLVTQEAGLDQPRAPIALWVVIGVHAVVKLTTASGALERLGSGVLLSTPWLAFIARWLVPLLVTGLAVLVMRFYLRRSGSLSLFAAFFVFILADAVLFSVMYLTPLLLLG